MTSLSQAAQSLYTSIRTRRNKWRVRQALQQLLSIARGTHALSAESLVVQDNFALLHDESQKIQKSQKSQKPQNPQEGQRAEIQLQRLRGLFDDVYKTQLPRSRQLKVLSGPTWYAYYDVPQKSQSQNSKLPRILLLGEAHTTDLICRQEKDVEVYEVQDWLWDLARDAPECLDIFAEDPWPQKKDPTTPANVFRLKDARSPLHLVRSQFGGCLRKTTARYCPMALRYHYADARVIGGQHLQDAILNEQDEYSVDKRVDKKWLKENGVHIRQFYLGLDESPESQRLFETFILLLADNDKYKAGRMVEEAKLSRRIIQRQLSKSAWFWTPNNLASIVASWPVTTVIDLWANVMDIYLLARLFTRFDADKMSRGPFMCRGSMFREIRNAIVYAGQAHVEFYHFVLKQLGYEPKHWFYQDGKKLKTQCISFREPFDFFEPSMETLDTDDIDVGEVSDSD